ncbi:putative esterase [Gordonia effusa NBRC 100432]|uniref:Putative esterase n=1 Tax=Gordonia effusa NBRC 100432 TaxID=1077974 RepID=H0R2W2_9ACTN|nr:esterase [Gordonia effusa]GAB19413.1 putative esterase [Gordonia effusa NBRC 100432]
MSSVLSVLVVSVTAFVVAPTIGTRAVAHAAVSPIPAPSGQYKVGVHVARFVDAGRADPWRPGRRELPVTITYPAGDVGRHVRAPYVTADAAAVAKRGGLDVTRLVGARTNGYLDAPVARNAKSLPVVIFSPGFLTPRFVYTALTEDLASRGHVVVAVDHTGDAAATVFPDGRVVGMSVTDSYSESTQRTSVATRVADIRYLFGQARRWSAGQVIDADRRALPTGLGQAVDPAKLGVFGHSMGGAVAAEVSRIDSRTGAAVNVDGALRVGTPAAPIVKHPSARPVLHLASSLHADSAEARAKWWLPYLANSRVRGGWSKVYRVADTGHATFTDLAAATPQSVPDIPFLAIPGGLSLGTAPRGVAIATQRALLGDLFDRFLKGRTLPRLDNPKAYPLVSELR